MPPLLDEHKVLSEFVDALNDRSFADIESLMSHVANLHEESHPLLMNIIDVAQHYRDKLKHTRKIPRVDV